MEYNRVPLTGVKLGFMVFDGFKVRTMEVDGELYFRKSDLTKTYKRESYTGCDTHKPILFKDYRTVVPQYLYKRVGYVSKTDLLAYIMYLGVTKKKAVYTRQAVKFVKKVFGIKLKKTEQQEVYIPENRKKLEISINMTKHDAAVLRNSMSKLREAVTTY